MSSSLEPNQTSKDPMQNATPKPATSASASATPAKKANKERHINQDKRSRTITFWIFLAPALISFVLVLLIPFILGIYYSFTDWNAASLNINWVGVSNYSTLKDPSFLHAFFITSVYAVFNMVAVNIVAFALAMLVTSRLKARNFFRSGFFVPNLIGGLILGYVWQFAISKALPQLGKSLDIDFLKSNLLGSPSGALFAIVLVSTWQYAGYIMMIYIAGIQNVSDSLIEAANIDGANYWHRLLHIIFPMIAPSFTIASFLTLTNSFKQFDVNLALTNGDPPIRWMGELVPSTQLFSLNIYKEAFQFNNMAAAQARAVVFFVVLVIISTIQVSINKKREVEL